MIEDEDAWCFGGDPHHVSLAYARNAMVPAWRLHNATPRVRAKTCPLRVSGRCLSPNGLVTSQNNLSRYDRSIRIVLSPNSVAVLPSSYPFDRLVLACYAEHSVTV